MKLTNVFVLVSLFFFIIACDNNVKKLTPAEEPDDDNSEIVDDSETPDTEVPDTETPDTEVPDTETPDTETPDSETPDSETPDEPVVEDTCYSAEFNGTDSKIEITSNEVLDLSYETWTIEAWIKQTDELTTDAAAIVAKKAASSGGAWGGNSNSYTYSLSNYYITKTGTGFQQKETTAMKGSATYSVMNSQISAEATDVSNSGDWTHIALVQTTKTEFMSTKPSLILYINGSQVKTGDLGNVMSNQKISIATSTEPLLIGSAFKGLIDSIKISNTAKYSENFTPSVLSTDENTVAFWDFTSNADDTSENGLNGTATSIDYVNDCKK